MDCKTAESFEEIASEAITKAEAVECDLSDFVKGLETLLDSVRERLELAKEEAGE